MFLNENLKSRNEKLNSRNGVWSKLGKSYMLFFLLGENRVFTLNNGENRVKSKKKKIEIGVIAVAKHSTTTDTTERDGTGATWVQSNTGRDEGGGGGQANGYAFFYFLYSSFYALLI